MNQPNEQIITHHGGDTFRSLYRVVEQREMQVVQFVVLVETVAVGGEGKGRG